MSPSEKYRLPVLGTIIVNEVHLTQTDINTGEQSPFTLQGTQFDYISEEETFFVCNEWYDEAKGKPQLVPKMFVKEIIKK